MPSLPPVKLAIPEPQDFIATEECASAFMSRSQHSKTLRHVPIPGFVLPDIKGAPEFRLPSNPADCCDLCKELQRLVVKAIGPDLRSESAQAIFYPCRYHLALDITVPDEEDPESSGYVIAKSFYVYSHPDVLCPWYLFKPYPFKRLEWAFAKLQECSTKHDCYNVGKDPTQLPTKVIRVGRRPEDIRLRNGDVCARYICLSHCWGSKQPLTTTKQNVKDHFRSIAWKTMPLLYQDIVRLAWELGIEYVWIDSLCIVQDSPDDWAREVGRMKSVYGNSWLTIAATSNPDCSSGILYTSRDKDAHARFASFKDCLQYSGATGQKKIFTWLAVPGDINKCVNEKHEKGACRWPLLNRGWVLQELVLSPRVLSFTAAGLDFKCREDGETENSIGGRCPPPGHLDIGPKDINASNNGILELRLKDNDFWSHIIEEYSPLKFTNQDDRLPALSGLAQEASQRLPSGAKYLAGLWSSSLFQGLSWYNSQGTHQGVPNAPGGVLMGCTRELCQVHQSIPSWSWAAIVGGVSFPQFPKSMRSPTKFHAQICGTECTPASRHDPTGRVRGGRINLRGPISPIINNGPPFISNPATTIYFDCPVHMDFNYLIDNSVECLPLYTEEGMKDYTAANLRYSIGLLLQPVVGKDSEYRRVGLVTWIWRPEVNDDLSAWFTRLPNIEGVVIV